MRTKMSKVVDTFYLNKYDIMWKMIISMDIKSVGMKPTKNKNKPVILLSSFSNFLESYRFSKDPRKPDLMWTVIMITYL